MPPGTLTERPEDGVGLEAPRHPPVAVIDDVRAGDLARQHGAERRGGGVVRRLVDDFDHDGRTQLEQDTAILWAAIPAPDPPCAHQADPERDLGVVGSRVQDDPDRQIGRHRWIHVSRQLPDTTAGW